MLETFLKCDEHDVQYPKGDECPACADLGTGIEPPAELVALEILNDFETELESLKGRGVVTPGLVQKWIDRLREVLKDAT